METTTNKLTNAEYHAMTDRVSHSMLEVFRKSAALYHGRFVTKEIPAPEPTSAMTFGNAVHAAVLEHDRFMKEYSVAPKCNRTTKAGKELWAAALELNSTAVPMTYQGKDGKQYVAVTVANGAAGPMQQLVVYALP